MFTDEFFCYLIIIEFNLFVYNSLWLETWADFLELMIMG